MISLDPVKNSLKFPYDTVKYSMKLTPDCVTRFRLIGKNPYVTLLG